MFPASAASAGDSPHPACASVRMVFAAVTMYAIAVKARLASWITPIAISPFLPKQVRTICV